MGLLYCFDQLIAGMCDCMYCLSVDCMACCRVDWVTDCSFGQRVGMTG